ncbi:MAG: fibronectin type III domain-containing protein [Phycisphaerales bacterium]
MPVLPPLVREQIEWLEAHLPIWAANSSAIGLSSLQVTGLTTLTTAARTAYDNAQAARISSKNSTTALKIAHAAMRNSAGDMINSIKSFAQASNNPNVYTIAEVPPPAAPKPAPAPATPVNVTVSLRNDGTINVAWDATQPAPGAEQFFTVSRRLNGGGAFFGVGNTGEKAFEDATVPAGTLSATYQVTARRRSQSSEPSEPVSILLGVPGEGAGDSEAGGQGLQLAA